MRHPSIEQLRDYAAAESLSGRRRQTAAHLAGCSACRGVVGWVREVRGTAAEATALPAPAGAWERISGRLAAGESVLLPLAADRPAMAARRWTRSPTLRAALLVLGLAGVGSAAVPGSPLRAWIARVIPGIAGADLGTGGAATVAPQPSTPDPTAGAPTPAATRLLVPLVDGALAVRIERPHPDLRIRVRVGSEPELLVHASGGAAGGRFRTGAGRLTIEEAGPGEVVLGVPAGAGRVSLEVDGQVYLLKEAGRVEVLVPVADTVGSEFIFSPRRGGGAPRRPGGVP